MATYGENEVTGGPIQHRADIIIEQCLNGFIVRVGCRLIVFETHDKLLSELKRYLENREGVTKEYLDKYTIK